MGRKKNVIIYIGVTAVVYLVFKYIMPLAAPFIIAFLLAAGLNGQMRFLSGRLKFKRSIAAVVLMVFWGGIIAAVLWLLGGLLITQIKNVIDNYELYYAYINDGMCSFCEGVDGFMGFDGGTTLADAVEEIKLRSRQYAKRQLTWFRRNPDMHLLSPENAADEAETLARKFLSE